MTQRYRRVFHIVKYFVYFLRKYFFIENKFFSILSINRLKTNYYALCYFIIDYCFRLKPFLYHLLLWILKHAFMKILSFLVSISTFILCQNQTVKQQQTDNSAMPIATKTDSLLDMNLLYSDYTVRECTTNSVLKTMLPNVPAMDVKMLNKAFSSILKYFTAKLVLWISILAILTMKRKSVKRLDIKYENLEKR